MGRSPPVFKVPNYQNVAWSPPWEAQKQGEGCYSLPNHIHRNKGNPYPNVSSKVAKLTAPQQAVFNGVSGGIKDTHQVYLLRRKHKGVSGNGGFASSPPSVRLSSPISVFEQTLSPTSTKSYFPSLGTSDDTSVFLHYPYPEQGTSADTRYNAAVGQTPVSRMESNDHCSGNGYPYIGPATTTINVGRDPHWGLNDRNPLGCFTSPATFGVAETGTQRLWDNSPNDHIPTSRTDRVVYPTPTPSPPILQASKPSKRPMKKSADSRHNPYTIPQPKTARNPGTSQSKNNSYEHLSSMNIQAVKAMTQPALVPATAPITLQALVLPMSPDWVQLLYGTAYWNEVANHFESFLQQNPAIATSTKYLLFDC
ncbi:hypothetical protein M422DRAFT_249718 [Sphaerobolus stellatus SS14]|uniref:Uncharacterized protein n=1 Tax=Sphaerobolus stellatus (strain SS14) TaxID=990650 RepID=A0A0C9W4N0_SPHS4|nr:hypothetical protein M422DRAFT_249718 [Sphaerobolus stellatus SS14]